MVNLGSLMSYVIVVMYIGWTHHLILHLRMSGMSWKIAVMVKSHGSVGKVEVIRIGQLLNSD
jgi:hypothetical protein